jgi:hypothetical protein
LPVLFVELGLSPIPAFVRAVPAFAGTVDEPFPTSRTLPALMAAVELPLGLAGFSGASTHVRLSGSEPVGIN